MNYARYIVSALLLVQLILGKKDKLVGRLNYTIYLLLETVHMCGFACSQVYTIAHDMCSLNYSNTNKHRNIQNYNLFNAMASIFGRLPLLFLLHE